MLHFGREVERSGSALQECGIYSRGHRNWRRRVGRRRNIEGGMRQRRLYRMDGIAKTQSSEQAGRSAFGKPRIRRRHCSTNKTTPSHLLKLFPNVERDKKNPRGGCVSGS